MKVYGWIVLFALISVFSAELAHGWHGDEQQHFQALYGEVLEVFPEQNRVRLRIDGRMQIFLLADTAQIYRGEQRVDLLSARPIADGEWQEVQFILNARGQVVWMSLHHQVMELVGSEGPMLVWIDRFGNVRQSQQL